MARIFVSYSRKNKEFCKRLADEFQKRAMDIWVDWEGIPPTVDWMLEIQKGIEEADTFLAIVSADWIASKVCMDELEIAVKNGKRLVPIVPDDIKWDDVPPALAQLNFIFFTEGYDFDAQLELLFKALDTDYDWLKTHRRLQVKALEWERGDRDNGFLLRGTDLEEAEREISVNANKDPHPTDVQREYILTSRRETDKQRGRTTAVLAFIIVMLLGITAYLITPRIQEAIFRNQARGELIRIPEGPFWFGTEDEYELGLGAAPLQEIHLPAFYIGEHEVTNAQYKLCVTYGDCTVPLEQADYKDPAKQDHPVTYVTLFQANNYCRWVGQRLLNEMEWERAVRGMDGRPWPWGEQPPSPEFVNMPGIDTSSPTEGSQPAVSYETGKSPEGVYNLVGNVWEWTSSFINEGGDNNMEYWNGEVDEFRGTEDYSTRGGGWANKIEFISQNNPNFGTDVRNDLGFRCGADVE